MKSRLGNPTFLIRLEPNEEKTVISLAKVFNKETYPKTMLAVAMNYEQEKKDLQATIAAQKKEITELKQKLTAETKYSVQIASKLMDFKKLIGKIADIKPAVDRLARSGNRLAN